VSADKRKDRMQSDIVEIQQMQSDICDLQQVCTEVLVKQS